MTGLREEKKRQNQLNIMESAKKMFTEQGYTKTSMAMIAKDAKVGTGTIYNYFPSKGALLLTIFAEEVAELEEENDATIEFPSGDLIGSLSQLMDELIGFFNLYSKSFWREIMHVMTEDVEESIHLRQGLFGLDQKAMHMVKQLIEQHADCFRVPIDAGDATNAVYGACIVPTMMYIYEESMTMEQFSDQLRRQIEFMFIGKLKSNKGED